jgi:hypothetical protein
MVAIRDARLNGAQGAIRELKRADFDNSEHPARMDQCVYCDVGFESGLSPSINDVVVARGDLAKSGRRVLTAAPRANSPHD